MEYNRLMDHSTGVVSGAGITSYLWLPSLTPWLQFVFLVVSIAWVMTQLYFKWFKKDK